MFGKKQIREQAQVVRITRCGVYGLECGSEKGLDRHASWAHSPTAASAGKQAVTSDSKK